MGEQPALTSAGSAGRVRSVDILRGLVCVLMAIDHVRVYSGIPAGGPTPGIFLTRWVTHFVAPAFCLFAGTGAFFMGRKSGNLPALSKFLITRGLLLVVLEMTLMRFAWAFNIGTEFMLAGVIWMLGWSMVGLGLFVRMPAKRVGWIGVGIVALQQLFNFPPRLVGAIAGPWSFIYNSPAESAPFGINVLYVIVPWVGLMMAGYGFGLLFDGDAAARDRRFMKIGLGMTAAWLVLGTVQALVAGGGGEAAGDGAGPPFWIKLLNQQKYPASQLFLLMTLGPMIALLPWAARARGFVADALDTIGRVPMFYYIAHLFVIHVLAIVTMQVRFGAFDPAWYASAPYTRIPPEQRWNLGLLYVVWAVAIVILYVVCLWYAKRKREKPAPWMAYI
jgi:uncharacterized membrane protein